MAQATETAAAAAPSDERVAFRGPLRRLLVSPEIGALIGAIVVWAFFWGNADTFGRASSTLNWLDVAAPLGIMAVAIALLMIGGEFDLSSGVMTGAGAIQIGLMGRYFMGDGVSMWIVVLAAMATAGTIGWFNGTLVNRTGLPSFIVTLATFFVLRGITLVMSKRFEGKVQVDQIDEIKGFKTFFDWVSHEWKLTEFGLRDRVFVTAVVVGGVVTLVGLLLQSLRRTHGLRVVALVASVVALGVALLGFNRLLHTDGVSANTLWSIVAAVGVIGFIVGLAATLFEPASGEGGGTFVSKQLLVGIGSLAVACVVPIPFDRNNREPILSWAASGLRPVIALLAAAAGGGAVLYLRRESLRNSSSKTRYLSAGFVALYAAGLTLVATLIVLQMSTVQALRAVAMMAFATTGIVLMLLARGKAASRTAKLAIGTVASVALLVLALVVRHDSRAERFRSGLFTAIILGAVLLLANTLVEAFFAKRTQPQPRLDRWGRWLASGGAGVAFAGLVVRVIYSNFTPAEAERLKAAGKPVATSLLRQSVLWWVLVTIIGAFVLTRMRRGNWIFAVGGNKDAARAIGVPASQVKVSLFVTVSMLACFAGLLIALRYKTVQANQGYGQELEFIIAAVVGGCLLTGGYGSVIGAALGASIMAMSSNGISTTSWNPDARFAFLGAVLLVAVLVNNFIRKKAQEAR